MPLAAFKVAFLSSVSELNWTWSEPRKIVCEICVRVNRTCSPRQVKNYIKLRLCFKYIKFSSVGANWLHSVRRRSHSVFNWRQVVSLQTQFSRHFGEAFLTQTAIIMPRARFWRAFLISFLAIYHKKLILRIYWPSRISCQPKTCALHYAEFWNIISIIITFVEEDDFYFSVRAKPAACVHR